MSHTDVPSTSGRIILDAMVATGRENAAACMEAMLRTHRNPDDSFVTKAQLLSELDRSYASTEHGTWLRNLLKKRPIRSLSGITSLTVLTKPFPCPGKCVFCPVDVRMPKSYIATEPGAQRAGRLGFDPYAQVTARLGAYVETGHPISKIELIVLGGTWSAYPEEYQRWFVKRLFQALNDFGVDTEIPESHAYPTDWSDRIDGGNTYNQHINASQYVERAYESEVASWDELEFEHRRNENAASRCVGMSLETRPDVLDEEECIRLRRLGATKIQIGIQSMDDRVLRLNKRGHRVARTREAIGLLRRFGFKVHAHWMPNLYGATAPGDRDDFDLLFDDPAIRPDELKVYPTALIQDTELEQIAARGDWHAYDDAELQDVLRHVLVSTPEYCRLTRIIRDIPSHEILEGNKKGNLRQIVEHSIDASSMRDIRAREIKGKVIELDALHLDVLSYDTDRSDEKFLQYITEDRHIAGFARLSLPRDTASHPLAELRDAAIIREVHVYGQAVDVGDRGDVAQHRGLGRRLIDHACELAAEAGYERVAIISAVGTRPYYEKLGFVNDGMYQARSVVRTVQGS